MAETTIIDQLLYVDHDLLLMEELALFHADPVKTPEKLLGAFVLTYNLFPKVQYITKAVIANDIYGVFTEFAKKFGFDQVNHRTVFSQAWAWGIRSRRFKHYYFPTRVYFINPDNKLEIAFTCMKKSFTSPPPRL